MRHHYYKPGKRYMILRGNNELPPIILIHGGAWCRGKILYMSPMAHYFNRIGFTVVVPEYTLGIIEPMSGLIQLVLLLLLLLFATYLGLGALIVSLVAITCIYINNMKWQRGVVDPLRDINDLLKFLKYSRVILLGHSAGAHLAALYATLSRKETIAGVICISGVYSDHHNMSTRLGRFLAHNLQFMPQPYPLYHTHGRKCKWLLMNCELDSGLKRDTFDFALALHESGHDVQVRYLNTSNHFTCITAEETFEVMSEWLDTTLE